MRALSPLWSGCEAIAMSHTLPTPRPHPWKGVRKLRGSQRKILLSYMWVVVFLAACSGDGGPSLRWTFADHRTCAEANVVTIAIRAGARELTRVACEDGVAKIDSQDDLVVEAVAYHGTVMYRGHAREGAASVTLRYVGGRD